MKFNWRQIHAARNSYAALYAACEVSGIRLLPVEFPEKDVTCYSLNSITWPQYKSEIRDADCITVAGGPHATACWQEVTRYADYAIVGEGEYTLPRLLSVIASGRNPGKSPIPGVASGNRLCPADHSVLMDAYPPFSQMKGYIEISRGCPFSCAYCQTPQIFGNRMRHRSLDAICEFAGRYLHARFVTPNAFAYGSDGVHPDFAKVELLLRRLKETGNQTFLGTFPSEVRPEFVSRKSLELVTTYCANTKIHFGAQSGSDAVLRKIRRGHTVADAVNAVELAAECGLTPIVDFILGFPFESDDDEEETLALIRWVAKKGTVHAHRFTPLPGTELAGSSARTLMPETEKVLGKLALSGKLTGSWSDQALRFFRRRPQ
ncbi:MAG: TIGR04013 family B12-binding domain/radical SAM domain-containing protein [Methanoregulaceae archaeon]